MNAKRQTVLITGPTSGIGNDFAQIFAERGYDLFLVSRNSEKLSDIKNQVEKRLGISVAVMPIDLACAGSAQKVYDEILRRKIEIHVLVNNSGFGIGGELTDMDMSRVAEMIQLNVTTLTELCMLFGRGMKKKRSGYILNVASTAGYQPTPFVAAYGATKSYVLNLSEALAKEMEDYNVVVTCLSPGPTDTHFFDGYGFEGVTEKEKGIWARKNLMKSRKVAEIGVNALFAKKLSTVAGFMNYLMVFSSRTAPRKVAAAVSKRIMKQEMSD
jgi:uncharacterized protein